MKIFKKRILLVKPIQYHCKLLHKMDFNNFAILDMEPDFRTRKISKVVDHAEKPKKTFFLIFFIHLCNNITLLHLNLFRPAGLCSRWGT